MAFSESFEDRLRVGKAARAEAPYKAYLRVIEKPLLEAMRNCMAPEKESHTPFVLIADITQKGKALAIDVRPSTNTAQCFATSVQQASFPEPPQHPRPSGFPIVVETSVGR
jgi:hypothetical protein